MARPSIIKSFSRSQVASAVATLADYGILFSLVEIFKVWYVAATALGAFCGAVVNFLMNRHWTFNATSDGWHAQAIRYAIVSGMSLILNSSGVWGVTEYVGLHYSLSVVVVSLLVGFLFNFPLQRYFVFRS